MKNDTTSQKFFEKKYRQNPDPWNFQSSPYETKRYEAMFRFLKGERYRRAFEPGCSIGIFTVRLASLCDRVEAIDISPTAVAQARMRCKDLPNVYVNHGSLPVILEGVFDLIVLSEIGYYFSEEQLAGLVAQLIRNISPRGTLLATHWLGKSKDHLLSGNRVHQIIGASRRLALQQSERHDGFRIDRWNRR